MFISDFIFKGFTEMLIRVGQWKAVVEGGFLVGSFCSKLSMCYHCFFVSLPRLMKYRSSYYEALNSVYFKGASLRSLQNKALVVKCGSL